MKLILNLAIKPHGLNNAALPGVLEVDYVRLYKRESSCGHKNISTSDLNPDPVYYDYFAGESLSVGSLQGISDGHALRFEASDKIVFSPGFYVKPQTGVTGQIKDFDCSSSSEGGGSGKRSEINQEFSLYPIPANDYIQVDFESSPDLNDIQNFGIYSFSGIKLLEGQTTSGQKVNVSNLTSGFYIITIYNDDNEVLYHERFIKN